MRMGRLEGATDVGAAAGKWAGLFRTEGVLFMRAQRRGKWITQESDKEQQCATGGRAFAVLSV